MVDKDKNVAGEKAPTILTTAPKTGDAAVDNTTAAIQKATDEAEAKGYVGEVPPPLEPLTS